MNMPSELGDNSFDVAARPGRVTAAMRLLLRTFDGCGWYDHGAVDAAKANVLPYKVDVRGKRRQLPAGWFAVEMDAALYAAGRAGAPVALDDVVGIGGPYAGQDAADDAAARSARKP